MVKATATAKFPSALVTQADIGLFSNEVGLSLSADSGIGDTVVDVATTTGAEANMWAYVVAKDGMLVMQVTAVDASAKTLTVTRPKDGTTDVALKQGDRVILGVVPALAMNQLTAEVVAMQAQLGVNLVNVGNIQTGTLTLGADSIADGNGTILFQTRATSRLELENDGSLTFKQAVAQAYKLSAPSTTTLAWTGQASGNGARWAFSSFDADGSDNVNLDVMLVGASSAETDRELLTIQAVGGAQRFDIASLANGLGAVRPVHLYTSGNPNQVVLVASGNVGAGTATPGTFAGTAGSGSYRYLQLNHTDRSRMVVSGTNSAGVVFSDEGAAGNDKAIALEVEDGVLKFFSLNDNHTVRTNHIMVWDMGTGDVGIGGAPSARLHVYAAQNETGLLIDDTTGTNEIRLLANVGGLGNVPRIDLNASGTTMQITADVGKLEMRRGVDGVIIATFTDGLNVGVGTSSPSNSGYYTSTRVLHVADVAANGRAAVVIDGDAAGSSSLEFWEDGAYKYALAYDGSGNRWALSTTDSDGGGTDADVIRIPDGQLSVDGNATFDDNAFDWVCSACYRAWAHWPGGSCPDCGGTVDWHDDASFLDSLVHSDLGRLDPVIAKKAEAFGILRRYEDGNVFVSMNKAPLFNFSAIAQLARHTKALEQELVRLGGDPERIKRSIQK